MQRRLHEPFQVNPTQGLSAAEIEERRTRYGANAIQTSRSRPAWRLLLDQFTSFVVALLGLAALVAQAMGDVVEAITILTLSLVASGGSSPARRMNQLRSNADSMNSDAAWW